MEEPLDRRALLPDIAVDNVALPQERRAPASQSTAVMLLASIGLTPRTWLASATLVALLVDLGTTPAGARAVVHRLTRRGVLEGRKEGRRTSYRLGIAAAESLARGGRAILTFGERAQAWDGRWTLVAFSVPRDADHDRAVLRGRLRWRSFAPLYDGLWVSPQPPDAGLASALADAVADAPGTTCSVFRAEALPVPGVAGRDPAARWDLDAVRAAYDDFLSRWRPLADDVAAGRPPSGPQALRARADLGDDYRRFVVLDPHLPLELMPPGWPRPQAREVFVTLFDGLLPGCLDHVRAVAVATGAPVPGIGGHTAAELAAGLTVS